MKNTFTKEIACFCFMICLLESCSISRPYTEEMKINLVNMFKADQAAQDFDMKKIENKAYIDSMNSSMKVLFKKNTEIIKQYYLQYGYPGIKENGKDASIKFWVIVQHSDHDVVFQSEILKAMEKELRKKNIEPRRYAYLYDRVMKNSGKKQLYGTQVKWTSNIPQPFPELEYPEKVDQLRQEMGLETLKEYYSSMKN